MTPIRKKTRGIVMIALAASIISILAPVSFPVALSPVPITLGTFAVYTCCSIVGAKKGTVSVLIYLALGAAGLPVFSGFEGGLQKIAGPTGGYLIGFVFCGFAAGFFADKFENILVCYAAGMAIGTVLCYLVGTVWLHSQTNLSAAAAFFAAVVPFLPGDAIKIVLATLIAYPVRRAVGGFQTP